MRFDLFPLRFSADNHATRFLVQLLRHLV
jgi:hypothetical protein